jgi:hypothetical protein
MSCGLDIFEDTATGSLELDRFKNKLREIWQRMLEETYSKYGEEMSKEEYLEANALSFADEPETESEMDNLMEMLEGMMMPEDKEGIKSDSKAPTYKGSSLKSNNEKGKLEATSYQVKHTMTSTPKDSKSSAKSSTYDEPTGGKIAPRKDAKVIRSFAPMAEKMKEELVSLRQRQNIGRRRELFRL